ncbi:MAG: hypothetical protein NTW49_08810 [Bacteroidia bacterium]|nr:hypothetical protein [Bacteroidia bacterium]
MEYNQELLDNDLKKIVAKALMHEEDEGMKILLFATFLNGEKKIESIADKVSQDKFCALVRNYLKLQSREVDTIRVDFFDAKNLNKRFDWRVIDLKKTDPEPVIKVEEPQFKGFGEAEVNSLVERKLQEIEKERQFSEMADRLKDQTKELSEAEETIDALTKTVAGLTEQIDAKNTLSFYAGIVGDFLEGIGLSKTEISKKLSGLMGIGYEKCQEALPPKREDRSGMVEEKAETPEEKQRNECCDLIREFLKGLPDNTLKEIYDILSDIEQDKSLSLKIINYLKELKTQKQ